MSKDATIRVLVVDDDVDHNDLEKEALVGSSTEFAVTQVFSADECLEAMAKSPFDLILVDYTLPGMDGLELISKLEQLGYDVPLVVVTGHGDESVAVEAMKKGAYDYLVKSPDMRFLEALPIVAKKAVERHRTELEKRRLEAKVRETTDYLKKIIDNAGDAILVLDETGRILSVNKAGQEMLGKTAEELRSTTVYSLVKDEKGRESLKRALDGGGGRAKRIDIKMVGPEKRTLEVSICCSSIEVGQRQQAVVIMRDMTEIHNIQRQLIESEKLAAIGDLVASVAHELNNKLGPILGYAELLQRHTVDDRTRQRLRVIEDSALKAKSIIEALLGFSRHRKPLRSFFDLNKVLQDALSLMEFKLKKNKVQVDLRLANDLPDLFADSVQIQQIFVNLLKNAYQAVQRQEDKRIAVETQREGDWIRFSVRDNGVGIPQRHLARVFDPFFTTRQMGEGVGLGLSVAYGIVKEHNGEIVLNSQENKGTEVVVRLPISAKPVSPQSLGSSGK